MFNQRARILQIAVVSIMCLVLTGAVQGVPPHYKTFDSGRSNFESSDAFPVRDRLYIAQAPTTFAGSFDTEMVSLSLKSSSPNPLSLTGLPGGTYQVDSFFDVFIELSVDGGLPSPGHLTGHGIIQMVFIPEPMNPPGAARSFQTEILSMDLSGDVGGMSIQIRESPSLPSPGKTTIRESGDGTFQIDSFFDVFIELSVQGGPFAPSDGSTRMDLTPVRLGQFEVRVAGNSQSWNEDPDETGNNDGWVDPDTGRRWLPYPQEEPEQDPQGNVEQGPNGATFWNEWWYNDPYDPERIKMINLYFNYTLTDPGVDGYVIVAVNWSTTDWSLNPPPGVDPSQQPPLMDFDPQNPSVSWVGRWQVLTFPLSSTNPQGTFESGDIRLPVPYNPEWVSIDVRGYNFTIEGGQFSHECAPDLDKPPMFEQLDWVGLTSSTPDSSWGRVTLNHNLSPGVYYFNLSLPGVVAPTWAVRNLSIESLGGDQKLMAYFNLGVPDGTDVSSLNYGYTITNAPLPGPPPVTDTASVPGLEFQIGTEDGADLGSPSAPETGASDIAVNTLDPTNWGTIPDKDKFVNQPQGANQCAPGAISNSLKYLQARGKISAALPTSIGAVGGVIGTTASGTPSSWYKKKKTHYKDHVNTRFIEAPLTVAKVKELIKELKDGQDIEMDLKGHVEVLVGMRLKADGTVDLDLYDDNQTDNKSDPMHTSPLKTDGVNQKVDGMILERFVIECPKEKTIICKSSFSVNTFNEWVRAVEGTECSHVIPVTQAEGEAYLALWRDLALVENPDPGAQYPDAQFMQADQIYAFPGDPDNPEVPDDGGAVMIWGGDPVASLPPGDYASALRYKYGADPDFSNSIITVVVTAPQFGLTGQVNQVSLGLEMPPVGSGIMRSWFWNCGIGPGFPIQWGVPTTLKIDTSMTGTTAATPTATNYLNTTLPTPFDITNVLSIIVDENATWLGGTPAPAPGGPLAFMWNYWHWLMVSPKTTLTKGYFTKWSQGPIVIDTGDPPLFWGWDEPSDYHIGPIAADDWLCEDDRPITDFHWWGSFPGWREPIPPCHPKAFHLGIWTDIPAVAGDPESYSHPYELVWEHICDNYVWNFAGYDLDPRQNPHGGPGGTDPGDPDNPDDPTIEPTDACFQYNQLLSQDDWFHQDTEGEPNRIYWLSIAPIWDYDCDHEWGWKTRPKFFMDNAVSITAVSDITGVTIWPPVLGSLWSAGVPLQIPAYNPLFPNHADAISWDLAFELTTIEPSYKDDPKPGDINFDGRIDLVDLSILAGNFPWP